MTVTSPVRFVERVFSPLITLFDGITSRINAPIPVEADIEKPYLD